MGKELIYHNDEADNVTCFCGEIMPFTLLENIYDVHGCYAGKACCYECFERHSNINLNYSRLDALENGEQIEADFGYGHGTDNIYEE